MPDFEFPVPPEDEPETPETAPELVVEEAPTPEPTPEPAPDPREKTIAEKEALLKNWEKELNRRSSMLGAQEKAKPEPADDEVELDPASQKALDAYMAKKFGIDPSQLATVIAAQAATQKEQLDSTTTEWFAAHPDADADAIAGVILELGVDVSNVTPKRAKQLLDTAYKSVKADPAPVDIDALVAAKVEEEMAKRVKDGETVIGITRKGVPADAKRSLEDAAESLNPQDMFKQLGA